WLRTYPPNNEPTIAAAHRTRATTASDQRSAVIRAARAAVMGTIIPAARHPRDTNRSMQVAVDPRAPAAPYEQIRAQIAGEARSGELPAGTRLPTVRALADELAVAPGTVARAYRTLEEDGVIETRGRHGTFVAAGGDATARAAFAAAVEYVT